MRKLLAALLFLLAAIPAAAAQTCAPVPALPDVERTTTYTLTAQTGPFAVGFQLYADSTDYQNWIQVYLNGALQSPATFTLTSPSGSLSTICRPITDATITFTAATTGTVVIVGDRRPRRISQFAENRGVSARDHNRVLSDIVATQREQWDRLAHSLQVPPTEAIAVLPSAATRGNSGAGSLLGFAPNGDIMLYAPGSGGGSIIGPTTDISVSSIMGSGSQHYTVAPTGNPISTLASLTVQGTTISTTQREFLANFGLTNTSTSGAAGLDKVALYAGIISLPSTTITQDQWSFNTVNTLSAGTGTGYNALGYELDFNNLQGNRGDADGGTGLAAPVAYGLELTGASSYRSTASLLIAGSGMSLYGDGVTNGTTTFTSATANFQPGDVGKSIIVPGSGTAGAKLITTIAARASTTSITLANAASDSVGSKVFYVGGAQWNRGIVIANNSVQQASFQDLASAEVSLDIRGSHIYGMDMGAAAFSTAAIRIPNNSPIIAKRSGGTNLNFLYLDGSDVTQVGGGLPVSVASTLNSVLGFKANGTAGASGTVAVRNGAGTASCNLVFSLGLYISTTC